MTLTIELTPEEEEKLRTLAERRGLEVEECARQLVTEQLPLVEPEGTGETLADLLGDYIGFIQGSGEANSENCGEQFMEHLMKKHREGHL